MTSSRFKQLDLNNLYTHQIFATDYIFDQMPQESYPSYLGVDKALFRYDMINIEDYMKKRGVPFKIGRLGETEKDEFAKDTFRCNGQKIYIYKEKPLSISFIGGCLWNAFSEKITLCFSNGRKENVPVFFYCYSGVDNFFANKYTYSHSDECLIQFVVTNRDNVPLYVYKFDVKINTPSSVDYIIMPDNDNMCIHAVTLRL